MAIYELWRAQDNKEFVGEEARNAAHAATIFSQALGVELTIEKGEAAPDYMLRRVDGNTIGKGNEYDIPVWVKKLDPSN